MQMFMEVWTVCITFAIRKDINANRIIMKLPKDPMMLFSVVNMKLRDTYPSLDSLCEDMGVSRDEITGKLREAGFEYNETANKFW